MSSSSKPWLPRVVGHEAAKAALRRSAEAGALEGSLLLCGPAGVGRALLARELAMALNCQDAGDALPCRRCGPCRRIEGETSGDVRVLRPEDRPSIGIEQVQGLLEEMSLSAVESRTRVFVIDPASVLTEPAQNALLKGLEEPPPGILLVLIAEREEELLSTIGSRCRVVRLGELSPVQVGAALAASGLAPDEVEPRAAWSGGSIGAALADDALEVAAVADELLDALASGEAARDPLETAGLLERFVEPGKVDASTQRSRLARVLGLLQRALRDALVARELGATPDAATRLSGASHEVLERLAALPTGRLETAIDRTVQVEQELLQNANTKFLLDGLVLEVAPALSPVSQAPSPATAGYGARA